MTLPQNTGCLAYMNESQGQRVRLADHLVYAGCGIV
jgi:hypothetical protein